MLNKQSSVTFTQDELKLIVNVFNSCPIKLGDAVLMLPVINKIFPLIKKEEPVEETPTVESLKKN